MLVFMVDRMTLMLSSSLRCMVLASWFQLQSTLDHRITQICESKWSQFLSTWIFSCKSPWWQWMLLFNCWYFYTCFHSEKGNNDDAIIIGMCCVCIIITATNDIGFQHHLRVVVPQWLIQDGHSTGLKYLDGTQRAIFIFALWLFGQRQIWNGWVGGVWKIKHHAWCWCHHKYNGSQVQNGYCWTAAWWKKAQLMQYILIWIPMPKDNLFSQRYKK